MNSDNSNQPVYQIVEQPGLKDQVVAGVIGVAITTVATLVINQATNFILKTVEREVYKGKEKKKLQLKKNTN